MNIKEKYISMKKAMFYIAYALLLISTMFNRVIFLSKYLNIISAMAICMFVITCIIQSSIYKYKSLFLIITTFLIFFLSYRTTNDLTMLRLLLVVLSAKDIDFEEFIKKDYKLKTTFLIIIVIFSCFGLTNNYNGYRENGAFRSSMGFSHPNIFGSYIMMIALEYLYIKKDNIKIYDYFIMLIAIFIINYFCDSRASVITLLVCFVGLIIFNKKSEFLKIPKIINKILKNSFIWLTVITAIITVMYNNNINIAIKINEIVSGRIRWIARFLDNYSITIFGNNIILVSTEMARLQGISLSILDNAYFHIIIKYGILIYLIFAISFEKALNFLFKKNDVVLYLIIISLLLNGLMETIMFKITINGFLLYFSNIIYFKEERSDDNGKC